jgi:auxin efflux carrier (AEC)
MVFLHAVESVFTIIIMFMTGYVLTKRGWFDERTSEVFSKLVLIISLPCYMIYNLMTNFDRALLEKLSYGLVIPFLSIGIAYILGIAASEIFKIKKERKGIFRSVFFTSNTIFIGLPLNLALFGEKSVPYVLLYYIANTTLFWTFGAYEISRDGLSADGSKARLFSKMTLRRVLSPALMGFVIGIVLIMLNVKLPAFIMNTCKYFGNLTTPLAMLFIGIVLYRIKFSSIRFDRDTVILVLARFIVSPAIVLLLTMVFKTPPLMTKVFIVQAAMPAMTNTSIVAKAYGADYEYGAVVTVITTLLSMAVIPLYVVLLG